MILALRYKELFGDDEGSGSSGIPFDINGHLIAIDTGRLDTDYMNSRFEKYLKELRQENLDPKQLEETLEELHKSFASLSQEEQKYANIFLHDIQSGNADIQEGKTFREYVLEYQFRAKDAQVRKLTLALGLDFNKLVELMNMGVNEANINEFGRFDDLKKSVDKEKAKIYFESIDKVNIPAFRLNIRINNLLKDFVIKGGFDIEEVEQT